MGWGESLYVAVIQLTPYPEFNLFFTFMAIGGLIGAMCNMLVRVISRS